MVLPVELVSFEATVNDVLQVFLTWRTAEEKNAKEFVIQRMNEQGVLNEIGVVAAKGKHNSYSFLDTRPEDGINYYRLKQKDMDGKEYFKPWTFVTIRETESRIHIYPNPLPGGQDLLLTYEGKPATIDIDFMDMSGKSLSTESFTLGGKDTFKINTRLLTRGIYILKIKTANGYSYKKLVVSE